MAWHHESEERDGRLVPTSHYRDDTSRGYDSQGEKDIDDSIKREMQQTE